MATLQTLPPELLLHTISFLPTSALFPLTRTSHYLHNFISTHASSICNTHITTHYPLEAAVLHPVLKDGWLVPTLPGIQETGEKHHSHHLSTLFTSHTDLWRKKMSVSLPGPQFLRFLELYSRDIRVRIAMELAVLENESEKLASEKPDVEKMKTSEVVQKLKGNEKFQSAITMYCISPFLSSLSRSTNDFGFHPVPAPQKSTTKHKLKSIKRTLTHKLRNITQKATQCFSPNPPNTHSGSQSQTSLLFGELPPEKVPSHQTKQESVAQGMRWYYGPMGVAPLEGERGELGLGKVRLPFLCGRLRDVFC